MTSTEATSRARKPRPMIFVVGVVVLVVAVAGGIGIVYLVENNGDSDGVRLRDGNGEMRHLTLAGRVTAVRDRSLTVTEVQGRRVRVETTSANVVGTAPGTHPDITTSSRVVVHVRDTARYGGFDVNEIVVLPSDSELGHAVTAVDGASLTFARDEVGPTTIDAGVNTDVYRVARGTVSQGATVLVSGRRLEGDRIGADEVLVLPPGTKLEANAGSD